MMVLDRLVGPTILMYHSIADGTDDPFAVTAGAFREQLSWLAAHGFAVVPLSFLLQSIQTREYGGLHKKVVITFDDGYRDFVTHALPVLLDFGFPATVFLVTAMLGEKAAWNAPSEQAPLMSADEARYIKSRGVSLGSHTATHARLTLLDQEAVRRQLEDSRDALTRLGEDFHAFAYPWGQSSKQIEEAVKESGYACALSVGGQMRLKAADIYLLPRLTMRGDMSLGRFGSALKRTSLETEIRRNCRAVLNKVSSAR